MEQAIRSRTARRAHSHASVLGDAKPEITRILHLLTVGVFIGVRFDTTLLRTTAELPRSHLQHFQRNTLVVAAGRLLPSYYGEWDNCLFGDDLSQDMFSAVKCTMSFDRGGTKRYILADMFRRTKRRKISTQAAQRREMSSTTVTLWI